jgi:signal transduction histidine kinase/ActR/RegA family two-component response regulator
MAGKGEATSSRGDDRNLRVLILTPQGRDSALAEEMLARSGLGTCVCRDVEELRQEAAAGAGCALIAEEALPREDGENLWFGPEPRWSSLPLVVLLARGSSFHNFKLLQILERRPNISFMERPVPKRTLVSVLRSAVEARRLQYEVRDALKALQLADRKKDEFLATLAHELRNPLAPIRNAIYVLKRSSGAEQQSGHTLRFISLMERQVDHLVRLVDDLLEISRISTGKIVLRKELVDLEAVIGQAIEISETLITSQQHQLSVDLGDQPLPVEGDPVRLVQILANLLNNAAKYTPTGGRIHISSRSEGDQVLIRVSDNGIGIVEEMLGSVFELFSQSHGGASGREQGGLGIGLALVRKLVEMHGGTVEVHSEGAGRGSEFAVRLPLAVRQNEQTTELELSISPQRVMVVDDNKDVADSFALLLETLGADVRVVYSGAEALALFPVFEPRLAFLDLSMPDMDGYEVARQLRAAPEGKGVVLVALSGWGADEDRRRAFEAGFDKHAVKPISLDALECMFASEAVGAQSGLTPTSAPGR